jgi:hypothetical protein
MLSEYRKPPSSHILIRFPNVKGICLWEIAKAFTIGLRDEGWKATVKQTPEGEFFAPWAVSRTCQTRFKIKQNIRAGEYLFCLILKRV